MSLPRASLWHTLYKINHNFKFCNELKASFLTMKHRGFYSILNGTVLSKKMNDNAWNSWQQNVFTCRWPKCYTVCPSNFGRCGSLAAFKDGLLQRLALVFKIFSFLCPLPGKEASLKLTILEKASSFTIKSTTQKKKKSLRKTTPMYACFCVWWFRWQSNLHTYQHIANGVQLLLHMTTKGACIVT